MQKAVQLDPRQVFYQDTLAELLFQRGDRDESLATVKRCIAAEPHNQYFQRQRDRITGGDRAVPLPFHHGGSVRGSTFSIDKPILGCLTFDCETYGRHPKPRPTLSGQ